MKRVCAALVALLIATGGYLLGVAPARADVVTQWSGGGTDGATIKVTMPDGSTKSVGTFLFDLKVGDQTLKAYCIQIDVSTSPPQKYTEGDFDAVQNHAKVLWAMLHGYPNVTTATLASAAGLGGVTAKDAITGTQAAIWHFSDGATPTATNSGMSTAAQQVYAYLTGAKNTGVTTPPAPSLQLSPTSSDGFVGDRLGPFTLTMSGSATAALSATSGTITDAAGTTMTSAGDGAKIYLTSEVAGSSVLTASATTVVEAGRSFVAPGRQTLILAQSGEVSSSDSAKVTWTQRKTAQPATPEVAWTPCRPDGSGGQAYAVAPKDTAAVHYSATGRTVTATAQEGYTFDATLPTGWDRVSDTEATYTTDVADQPCATEVTLAEPAVSWESCQAPGVPGDIVISPVATKGISYSVSGMVVTATADGSHRIGPSQGWVVNGAGTSATYTVTATAPDCTVEATPVAPTLSQSQQCGVEGSYTIPAVTGVEYVVDGVKVAAGTYPGPFVGTVTARPATGYAFDGASSVDYQVEVAPAQACPTVVTPQSPTVVQGTCETGPSVTPATTPGISYQVTGDVVPGATVVVTATPQDGHVLAPTAGWVPGEDGAASWTTTLDQAVDCGSVSPTPTPTTPTGGGSVTPTPPAGGSTTPAGSGGTLPHTGGDGAGILMAGLAALAGGAALLLAGRRRSRGAHQH